jgi:hypothetical protein
MVLIGEPPLLQLLGLSVNGEIRSGVTYSVTINASGKCRATVLALA